MANIELDGPNKKIKVDSGDLTLDVPGDIVLDADGGDVVFADGGTNLLKVTNSSSDVVLQPQVDTKDIVFKQYDGTVVATVEDNATFNIPASKLAIGGTAVTSTAAELNLLDGGTSVGGSITLADGDGVVVNDGGTMKTIPASDVKTYAGGAITALNNATENELVTVGSTTTELDAEAKLISDGSGIIIRNASVGTATAGKADMLVIEGNASGDTAGMSILTANDEYGVIHFGDDADVDVGKIEYYHGSNYMRFYVNGSEMMRLRNDGVMTIGTTSASGSPSTSSLELSGTEAPLSIINETATNSSDRTSIALRNASGTMVGNVGVDNSNAMFNTSSDYRLKENEVAISDGIERLKQLKPYKFNFKIQADKTVDGFFAHEVSSIVPEAITGTKDATETLQKVVLDSSGNIVAFDVEQSKWTQGKTDGEYANDTTWEASKEIIKSQSIDQSKLVPLLTSALQEAITKIETLEARVTTLEE